MSSQSDITILLTVFNGSKTIDRCLESIFLQSHPHCRIVCVNDASTDDTMEKLYAWQKKFGPEKMTILLNETNLGVTKSSNRGLQAISTKYTARIDADDWWDTEKIAKQIEYLERNPDHKIIGCNYINFNKNIKKEIITTEYNETIKKNIIRRNPFAHSCVVYETKLANDIGGYEENIKYGGDYELYLRFFPKTNFHNLQEFLCFRSIENDGISIKKQREQMLQSVRTQVKYIRRYKLPIKNYLYILEPLAVAFTPKFIRNLKRSVLG